MRNQQAVTWIRCIDGKLRGEAGSQGKCSCERGGTHIHTAQLRPALTCRRHAYDIPPTWYVFLACLEQSCKHSDR